MSKQINTRTPYKIIGSDYSAQEPRMTTFLSGDPTMYKAYIEGKDLYAMIAQSAFDNNYEDNLEFWPEGTELEIDGQKIITGKKTHLNKAGKERRSVGKVLNLAATYGMGGSTAGAKLGKSAKEGEELLNNFFKGFPGVETAIRKSKEFLKEHGYVEDFVGRRRRLSDINLPPYVVTLQNPDPLVNFNPFIGCADREEEDERVLKWKAAVEAKVQSSQRFQHKKAAEAGRTFAGNNEMGNTTYEKLAEEALKEGVIIQANTGRIAQASRQCFNARIQGSAASLTKMAMVDIFNDDELKKLQAELIITVHDEVLVECPAIFAEAVEKRLPEIMIEAAKKVGDDVPQACDPYNVTRWYSNEAAATLLEECKKLEQSGKSHEVAVEIVCANHCEVPREAILAVLSGKTDELCF